MYKFVASLIIFGTLLFSQDKVIEKNGALYLSNKVVVKFKETGSKTLYKNSQVPASITSTLEKSGVVEVKQHFKPTKENSKYFKDVNNTFVLTFSGPYDAPAYAKKLSRSKEIEWAEPYFFYRTTFEPNDPKFRDGTQWYLNHVSAPQAWEISQGSGEIIIAINDTGIDWDHPDLADIIWINEDEIPGNGVDDDNNGYVDDVRGWDFGGLDGTPDNDPMEDSPTHGTYVAGFASAVTNNGQGIAGMGFNCKLMPVKTSQGDLKRGTIAHGLAGIIYAAENGAQVINLSWGGSPYSQALQDAINYATSLGSLVISSSDNDNTINPTYPASYENVLSVGGTNYNDERYVSGNKGSNYGPTVDVMAPAIGEPSDKGMYSTWQDDAYLPSSQGTSLAAPIVAGLAGLVFHTFPNYTPQQVGEQIRVNTDYIDDKNPGFEYYLGTGRINAFKTLNNTSSISVRADDLVYTDLSNGNGVTEPGESFTLGMRFINYLNPSSDVTVSLISRSEFVTITQGTFTIPSLGTLQSTDNYAKPFTFTVDENIPVNQDVELLITFNSGVNYSDFQLIHALFNTTYLTQQGNNITLTITSNGMLGFNDYNSSPSEGDGLTYDGGMNLLFEGAFMYGVNASRVMDAVHKIYLVERGPAQGNNNEPPDFVNLTPFSIDIPGSVADHQGRTIFNDGGDSSPLGIETHLNTYSFAADQYDDFIILKYVLYNRSETVVDNLYAGIFLDFDMNNYADDKVEYDDTGNFAYVIDQDTDVSEKIDEQIAVGLISDTQYGYHALSNDGPFEEVRTTPEFVDEHKWITLSSGVTNTAHEGDVALTVSGGPYSIQPDSSVVIAFTIAGGYSVDELKTAVQKSREAYEQNILNQSPNDPTELLDFSNTINEGNISISWTTKNEKNTRGFKLFQNDSLLVNIASKGNESGSATYEYSFSIPGEGIYEFKINQVFLDFSEITIATKTIDLTESIPNEFALHQNFPNPFNSTTKIKFDIPHDYEGKTGIILYDGLGREVELLFSKNTSPGKYEIEFNADEYGLSSGVYFYRLTAGENILTKKMLLMK